MRSAGGKMMKGQSTQFFFRKETGEPRRVSTSDWLSLLSKEGDGRGFSAARQQIDRILGDQDRIYISRPMRILAREMLEAPAAHETAQGLSARPWSVPTSLRLRPARNVTMCLNGLLRTPVSTSSSAGPVCSSLLDERPTCFGSTGGAVIRRRCAVRWVGPLSGHVRHTP